MSNSLDPDQAVHFMGPDLGVKPCLQRISVDDASRQRVNCCCLAQILYIPIIISIQFMCSNETINMYKTVYYVKHSVTL